MVCATVFKIHLSTGVKFKLRNVRFTVKSTNDFKLSVMMGAKLCNRLDWTITNAGKMENVLCWSNLFSLSNYIVLDYMLMRVHILVQKMGLNFTRYSILYSWLPS